MNKIYMKWWDNGNKIFDIINYKDDWKKNNNPPILKFQSNGARKSKGDTCLDIKLTIGYIVFNYVNFNLK